MATRRRRQGGGRDRKKEGALYHHHHKVPSPTRDEMMSMLANAWRALMVDSTKAFKNLFVTNAFDGSGDYLVSDKLFRLIGVRMLEFRTELLVKRVPKFLAGAVKQLIPPKGIKRNFEGSEFLPILMILTHAGQKEQDKNDQSDGESECSENESVPEEAIAVTDTENPAMVVQTQTTVMLHGAVSLQNACQDENVNKDAKFLDKMFDVMDMTETSLLFRPHAQKIRDALNEARKSVKKCIENEQ